MIRYATIILRSGFALAAAAILLAPATGHAGPPYMTDDPDPVPFRHWEVYLATQHFINAMQRPARVHSSI